MLEILSDGGRFKQASSDRDAEELLDTILENRHSGRMRMSQYVGSLEELILRHPNFIDGHSHLGFALLKHGKAKQALAACEREFLIGEAGIPPRYRGLIEWSWLENRPFLRAAQGIALSHQQLGQRAETIAMMERILKWNPNDNQGLRYLIGSEYLRSGATAKATTLIVREADAFPPYHYEAALIEISAGRFVDAATRLRRAFVANNYIAETLCGAANPMKLAIWHGSNLAEPEVAKEYVDAYGDLWRQTPAALQFLRWLHSHPKVAIERAGIFEKKEALFWEREVEIRRTLGDEEERRIQEIDDRLSQEIVRKREDRYGRSVDPWLHVSAD